MKLSKTSWHYLLFRNSYNRGVPCNLCPYFWMLLWAIVCFPFNFIWNLPSLIIHTISKIWDKNGFLDWNEKVYFGDRFKISLLINLLTSCLISMILIWFKQNEFSITFGVIGYVILVIILGFLIQEWYKSRPKKIKQGVGKIYKEPKPNILVEFIKAKYNRYCPKIEWTSSTK